jgi:hypothetical protein
MFNFLPDWPVANGVFVASLGLEWILLGVTFMFNGAYQPSSELRRPQQLTLVLISLFIAIGGFVMFGLAYQETYVNRHHSGLEQDASGWIIVLLLTLGFTVFVISFVGMLRRRARYLRATQATQQA